MTTTAPRLVGSDVEAIEDVSEFERRLVAAIDDSVEDPHVPLSLVEMGMIYDVRADGGEVAVEMTYPCMGCPAYGMLQDDVERCLLAVNGVEAVAIEVVWDPVWSKERLDEAVRRKLREAGTAI